MSATAGLGYGGILLALVSAVGLAAVGTVAWRRPASVPTRALVVLALLCLGGGVLAFSSLELALLTDDFSIRYIAENHSTETTLLFSIATAWAALEGSLLLWALILAGYVVAVACGFRSGRAGAGDRLGAGALAVLGLIATFFFGVLATVANPFETLSVVPRDGPGPNPLLQDNVLMAVHPPLLYVGYVGFSVPYAFAMSALAGRAHGPQWVLRTQRWALFAWTFLTAGILVGAWWSYEVLGWGGYWAWDPVENASLMPWLAATAYLHSSVMQARRGVLPAWSIGLIIATFSLTILGTFLTRSGVIASVHAFSQSQIGPALLTFLLVIVFSSLALFATRAGDLAARKRVQQLFSREGMFLVNNLVLTVLTITVLTGTLYPIVVEAITGDQLSVGRPYFDRVSVPLSLLLIGAMAIGPLTPSGQATFAEVWARLRLPLRLGLGVGAATVLLGQRHASVILVTVLATTVIVAAFAHYIIAVEAEAEHSTPFAAVRSVLTSRPGYWGGQVSHIGLVVLALGITTSTSLAERQIVELDRGDRVQVGGFELEYLEPVSRNEPNRAVEGALIEASRGGSSRTLEPRLHRYEARRQAIGVPAVWTTNRGDDLYLTIVDLGPRRVTLNVFRYPFIFLIWSGGLLAALGGAISLILRRLGRRTGRTPARVRVPAAEEVPR